MPADRLKLAAVLEMVDKFTKPARDMVGGAQSLRKHIGETRDQLAALNQQTKQVQHLKQLQARLGETGDKLAEASRHAHQLQEQLSAAGDKGSARLARQLERAQQKVAKLTTAQGKLRGEYRQSAQAAREAGINTQRLNTEEARLAREAARANDRLERQGRHLKLLNRWSGRLGQTFQKLKSLGKWSLGAGMAGMLAAAPVLGNGLNTISQFEDYQATLETIEGSQAKAKASLDWVSEFAAKTPYQLDQVNEAFVRLRSYGLDPTSGLLRTLGDTSAAMGKDVMSAVEAIADAVTGENERLKEFGITSSTQGDLVTYTYTDKSGLQQQMQVMKGDRAATEQALREIWDEKYGGAMERRSRNWSGMFSNLQDYWARFQIMVMDSGPFERFRDYLSGILATLGEMAADGRLQAWAERIGERITQVVDVIGGFASGLWDIGQTAYAIAAPIAEFVGGWDKFAWAIVGTKFAPLLGGLDGIGKGILFIGKAMLANPILAVIAGIAAGAYLIYRNWDAIAAWFGRVWGRITQAASAAWDTLKALFFDWHPLGILISHWGEISDYLHTLPSRMLDLGTRILDGLAEGIRSRLAAVKDLVGGLADGVGGWFAEKLGIHSPSRVFAGYGANIAEGVGVGINAKARAALDAAGRLAGQLPKVMPAALAAGVATASPAFAGGAPSAAAQVVMHVQIVVNAAPGQSAEAIGREVARQLTGLQREAQSRAAGQLFDEV